MINKLNETNWAIDSGLPEHPNDKLIQQVLERIETDEELEHVYDLLNHIPQQVLIDYVTMGTDDVGDHELKRYIQEELTL
tara:strand:- start:846 stop:1085 length:240 start_codon:yes stop_codon:yes gene_type:complete